MIFDAVLTYQFIKKLTTPFNKMPAYALNLIDDKGNFLKSRKKMTNAEKKVIGIFDVMIINLKKLIAKIPGGGSRIGTIAATMILLRTKSINENYEFEDLEEIFNDTLSELISLEEDSSAAINTAGSGDIAGIGVPTNSYKGFPPISKAAATLYKNKNIKQSKIIMGMMKRRNSVTEADTFARDNKEFIAKNYRNKNTKFEKDVVKAVKKLKVTAESTLEYHMTLNPKIWDTGSLKQEVRGKLLQIAEAWREFAKISPGEIIDIILTGGNTNFNYTDKSDLDIHLIIDRSNLGGNPSLNRAFIDEYLQDKKILWTLTHPNIHIYGYPVELYAQDINDAPHINQGVYSVMYNNWVQQPEYLGLDFENDSNLQKKVMFYMDMIDKMIEQQVDSDAVNALKERIKSMRGDSIKQGGEFSFGNLVFKDLRNSGYLDKLSDYDRSRKDAALSLG